MKPNLEKLRIAIAEKRGWTWWQSSFNKEQKILARTQLEADSVKIGSWVWSLTPDYPRDSVAALELVEWMAKLENGGDHFDASMIPEYGWRAVFSNGSYEFSGKAESLPLAICLAFAKANGIEIEYND